MNITYRLVAPDERRLHHRAEGLFDSAARAWTHAARAVTDDADDTDLPLPERMTLISGLLHADQPGVVGDWEVLRFAHTDVSVTVGTSGPEIAEVRQAIKSDGLALARYGGGFLGTWATTVGHVLDDLLSDAESDGVLVRATIMAGDLPETLRPLAPGPGSQHVWLQGVAHDTDAEGRTVFADGVHVDLSDASYVHVTY